MGEYYRRTGSTIASPPPSTGARFGEDAGEKEKDRAYRVQGCCTTCYRVYLLFVLTLLALGVMAGLVGLYVDSDSLTGRLHTMLDRAEATGAIPTLARFMNLSNTVMDTMEREGLDGSLEELLTSLRAGATALDKIVHPT